MAFNLSVQFMFMFMFVILLCGLRKSLRSRTSNFAAVNHGSFSGREADRSPLFSVEFQDERSGALPPFPIRLLVCGGGALYSGHYMVAILGEIP